MKAKRLILLMLAMLALVACSATDWKEGDIILQMSKSKQSPLIQYATSSVWSHCGIIVYKGNEPYVLEASNVVKLTPLKKFIDRGRFGATKRVRYFDKPVKIKYKKYLGVPYDLQFSLKNKKFYCSELVWVVYKEQFGVTLCEPKPLSKYNTLGLSKVMKRRGISEKSLFIAPCDLIQQIYIFY